MVYQFLHSLWRYILSLLREAGLLYFSSCRIVFLWLSLRHMLIFTRGWPLLRGTQWYSHCWEFCPPCLSVVPCEAPHEEVLELDPGPCVQSCQRSMWKLRSSQRLLAMLFSLTLPGRRDVFFLPLRLSKLASSHPGGTYFIFKLHVGILYSTGGACPWKGCMWRRGCWGDVTGSLRGTLQVSGGACPGKCLFSLWSHIRDEDPLMSWLPRVSESVGMSMPSWSVSLCVIFYPVLF